MWITAGTMPMPMNNRFFIICKLIVFIYHAFIGSHEIFFSSVNINIAIFCPQVRVLVMICNHILFDHDARIIAFLGSFATCFHLLLFAIFPFFCFITGDALFFFLISELFAVEINVRLFDLCFV